MTKTFSLMFYNTENLYDTIDDPNTMDDEFTPAGFREWTVDRYHNKVEKLTNVITKIVHPNYPDVISLAEIENKTVMESILQEMHQRGLKGYSYLHYDSPDERGSDVAMIYNTGTFRVLESHPVLVRLPGIEDRTRDILYVKGTIPNGEVLHLFVIHFPSRAEGRELSERRRYFAASELRNAVYKLTAEEPDAKVIIMGDFNDTPDDNSVDEVLGAHKSFEDVKSMGLYNLLYPRYKKGLGTTYHKGWLMFDQVIVSGNLLLSTTIDCKPEDADLFNPPWLLFFGRNNRPKPNRTYSGKYVGGYSDHLPIYLRLNLK